MRLFVFLACLLTTTARATWRTVALNGSGDFTTIAGAAAVSNPGDVIHVRNVGTGIYNEQPTITRDGLDGQPITFLSEAGVVCRGFRFSSANYIDIIGFEITHSSPTAFDDGIVFGGITSHIGIYDNWIHNIHANHGGIVCAGGATPTYITLRGNRIEDPGYLNGVQVDFSQKAIASVFVTPNHWLIEYNIIERCSDGIIAYGANHIIRNNSFTDYTDRTVGLTNHVDGFQPGSDGVNAGTRDHVYEANWIGELNNHDSHFGLWQDTLTNDDRNIIIRGNVAHQIGSGGVGVISTKNVKTYHNTFNNLGGELTGSRVGIYYIFYGLGASLNYPTNGSIVNSILAANDGATAIDTSETTGFRLANNVGWHVGANASYISTSNPLFVDTNAFDFHLQVSSPAIAVGTNLTTVATSDGTGTSLDVADATYLTDGYGIIVGDTVTIVGAGTVTLTGISGNTLTFTPLISWTNGAPVIWGPDETPDIGALPYGSTDLSAAELFSVGENCSVETTGGTRFVIFYTNGIPAWQDKAAPYTYTNTIGATMTARAFALYAQQTPVLSASQGTAPTISVIGDQTIVQDTSTADLPFTVGDTEDDADDLTHSATSSNHALADDNDVVISGTGENLTIQVTPNTDQTGFTIITVAVTDLNGLETSATFRVDVISDDIIPARTGKFFPRRR